MASSGLKPAAENLRLRWPEVGERFGRPAFDALRDVLERLDPLDWPALDVLNALAHAGRNSRGVAPRFVAPGVTGLANCHYEMRIAEHGEIVTRDNWHDLFNALVWITFPRAKAAISEAHARFIGRRGEGEMLRRSRERDLLTLFDESGAIIVSEDEALLDLIRNFRWKEIFWQRRAEMRSRMQVYLFGHALFEKMLAPFPGITAKAYCLRAPADWKAKEPAARIAALDDHLAALWADDASLKSSRILTPLPLLGWPGWHPGGMEEKFYDDHSYFRPGYTRRGKA